MTVVVVALLVTHWAVLLVLVYAVRRVGQVLQAERRALDAVHRMCDRDVAAGREWRWRYDVFQKVSLSRQVWSFWRRPDSFYEDAPELTRTEP